METGTVVRFIPNVKGGFGFLKVEGQQENLYFQRNDGGPVVAGRQWPEIQTWQSVAEPKPGDDIKFERRKGRDGRFKAAPWCYSSEWQRAMNEIANRPPYRLLRREWRGGTLPKLVRQIKPTVIWEGYYVPELIEKFGSPAASDHLVACRGEVSVDYWFEIMLADGWQKCSDPRLALVQVGRLSGLSSDADATGGGQEDFEGRNS